MYKDPTEFRLRFAAWKKEGLLGYKKGKRPYIGGDTQQARSTLWRTDRILDNAVDSIANAYGIQKGVLQNRLNEEGFVDKVIQLKNDSRFDSEDIYSGNSLLFSKKAAAPFSGINDFGLDDAATMINNGLMLLINESWFDEDGVNEKGRLTHGVVGANNANTIGLQASALKHFEDLARKDNPGISDYDAGRYALAYYNRGQGGGRKWAKNGAKGYGYNVKPVAIRPKEESLKLLKWGENDFKPTFKDGKLPKYVDGTRLLWDSDSKSWNRITDDAMGLVFADVVATPRRNRLRFNYEKQPTEEHTPNVETDKQYTARRIAEELNRRTWLSDAADAISLGVGFTPAGNVELGLNAVAAAARGNYEDAAMLGAGLVLPNILQKPLGWIGRKTLPLLTRWHGKFSNDASDIALTGIGAAGGGIAGYLNSDENEKLRNTVGSIALGSSVGIGRGLARSIIRDPKTKIIVPLKYRELTDAILDPFEYFAAKHYGYYKKNPDIVGFAKNDAIRRGLAQNAADDYGKHIDLTTQILDDPSYVIKHGYKSNGVTEYGTGRAMIGIKKTRRNSNLPPRDAMGFKNPLLGVFAHENNHAFNFENTTGVFLLSMPDGTYYSPNDYYYDNNIVSKLKTLNNNKQSTWQKSPEEIESEIHNYLAQNNTTYLNLSTSLKKELRDLLSYRFNISKKNLGTLFDMMEHIGARSENMHHLLPNSYPFIIK